MNCINEFFIILDQRFTRMLHVDTERTLHHAQLAAILLPLASQPAVTMSNVIHIGLPR